MNRHSEAGKFGVLLKNTKKIQFCCSTAYELGSSNRKGGKVNWDLYFRLLDIPVRIIFNLGFPPPTKLLYVEIIISTEKKMSELKYYTSKNIVELWN